MANHKPEYSIRNYSQSRSLDGIHIDSLIFDSSQMTDVNITYKIAMQLKT